MVVNCEQVNCTFLFFRTFPNRKGRFILAMKLTGMLSAIFFKWEIPKDVACKEDLAFLSCPGIECYYSICGHFWYVWLRRSQVISLLSCFYSFCKINASISVPFFGFSSSCKHRKSVIYTSPSLNSFCSGKITFSLFHIRLQSVTNSSGDLLKLLVARKVI